MKLELKPTIQERSLRAFLDLAILCALVDRPMTGYEINSFFVKKFGILIGPSMVYSKLYSMERKGWIKCTRNRAGRVYSLTEQGQKIVDSMTSTAEEIQGFIKILLRSKDRTEKSQRADCESLDKLVNFAEVQIAQPKSEHLRGERQRMEVKKSQTPATRKSSIYIRERIVTAETLIPSVPTVKR